MSDYNNKVALSDGTVLIDLTADTVAVDKLLSGYTAHDKSGTPVTGNITDNGAVSGTIVAKAGAYTVPQGYHNGSGTVAIDSTEQGKIISSNIRENITILGVTGTMSGTEDVNAQTVSVTPNFSEQVITPDATQDYNYLSQVTVAEIPVAYAANAAGGDTVTIG